MHSTHQRIAYVLDITRLDVLVDLARSGGDGAFHRQARPWLALCAEPVSQRVLAFHLHPDPPHLSTMRSLLYQALAPSEGYPYGRMPDELWSDSSVLFSVFRQKGLAQHIHLAVSQIPSSSKGVTERLFGRLAGDLQRDFSTAHIADGMVHEGSLPTFSDVDQWCKQWARSSHQTTWDDQRSDFLAYCETQWSTRKIPAHVLDLLLEGPWPACVSSAGIEYRGAVYWHPALPAPRTQDMTIRTIVSYLPPPQLEVFVQNRWICSAPLVSSQQTGGSSR